jgi:Helix-turn-helix domain
MSDPLLAEVVAVLHQIAACLGGSQDSRLLRHPQYDPILTRDQAAEYLGLHPKTVAKDTMAGDLIACRRSDGGALRYRLSDLNNYLNDQRAEPIRRRETRLPARDWSA